MVNGATLGKFEAVNKAVGECAKHTAESGKALGKNVVEVGNGLVDSTPGIGHIKGAIHYAAGDREGGD